MDDIEAIDAMCRPYYARPEVAKNFFHAQEWQVLAETTFGGVKQRLGLEEGEEWKVLTEMCNESVEATIKEMDEVGVQTLFMDQVMQWSRHDSELLTAMELDDLAGLIDEAGGRFVGGVGYNPNRIEESLQRIERAVEDLGFKYVWFHPTVFGLTPSSEQCYPLYAKCLELDVPVAFQTGQSAEPTPMEGGRPTYANQVAMDFPTLDIVLTHAGWPWFREWYSMLWRHPNVYGNIGGYLPSFLPEALVDFIDSGRIRHKVMWATNGLGLERCKREFLALPLREESKRRILRENALELFDID